MSERNSVIIDLSSMPAITGLQTAPIKVHHTNGEEKGERERKSRERITCTEGNRAAKGVIKLPF
jgi:hypothetical protein